MHVILLPPTSFFRSVYTNKKCIFCMIKVQCRHNPPTTNKHEGTIHGELGLLASSLLLLRVGVSTHISQFAIIWKSGLS